MLHKLVSVMAWACLLFIAAATLSPPYLRPRLTEDEATLSVLLEHVGAFAVMGFLFSSAYSRTALVCLLVLGSAVTLELLQLVVPDRDARVIDALEKLLGGGVGIIAARLFCRPFFANSAPNEPEPDMEQECSAEDERPSSEPAHSA
jgi:VanZ family protein